MLLAFSLGVSLGGKPNFRSTLVLPSDAVSALGGQPEERAPLALAVSIADDDANGESLPAPVEDETPSDEDSEEPLLEDCDDAAYYGMLSYRGPPAGQLVSPHVSPLNSVSIRARIPRPSGQS